MLWSTHAGPTRSAPSGERLRRRGVEKRVLLHRPLLHWQHRLAGFAVQIEHDAVRAHGGHQLARPSADVRVVENERGADVVLPDVVMYELVVPANPAGLEVERHHRVIEKIVAGAKLAAPLRHGVAGFEIDETELGVHRRRRPQRAAAIPPDVAVLRPGVVTLLAGAGHHFEIPEMRSGLRVEAKRSTTREVVAARHNRHDDAVAIGGRGADALRGNIRLALVPPHELARLLADGDDARIAKAGEQQAVADADAAAAAERGRRLEHPERLAGRRIEREYLAGRRHDEHASAGHHDRRFRHLAIRQLDRPRTAERLDVRRVDLRERGIARRAPNRRQARSTRRLNIFRVFSADQRAAAIDSTKTLTPTAELSAR